MHVDPLIPPLVGVIAVVLVLGLVLQVFRQPQLVAYILAGVAIGPSGLGWLTDQSLIEHLGAIGVTLLLFFIGMEVSPAQLARGWRIALLGTLFQILVSVALTWVIGTWLGWSLARIVLLGFVISLSSTAVVLKLLKDRGELGDSWSTSLYSGALLAQIGEFSFVLASVGMQSKLITGYGYQLTIAVIALTLVLSPGWIALMKQTLGRHAASSIGRYQPKQADTPPGANILGLSGPRPRRPGQARTAPVKPQAAAGCGSGTRPRYLAA